MESIMLTRRTALMGAAIAALMMAAPVAVRAADDLKLPRQKVELVAPPFVHAHEQATKAGPKIFEFKLTIREKEVVIDDAGTKVSCDDVRRIDAGSDDGGPRGRLHGAHAD
jgi:nitrite reductase (NO-forming)